MVILFNHSSVVYTMQPRERMAQGVIVPVYRAVWEEGPIDAAETARGTGGFGSTGGRP